MGPPVAESFDGGNGSQLEPDRRKPPCDPLSNMLDCSQTLLRHSCLTHWSAAPDGGAVQFAPGMTHPQRTERLPSATIGALVMPSTPSATLAE